MVDCVCLYCSLFLQGVEGPRGPPGSRGPQGEGYPGPKARISHHALNTVTISESNRDRHCVITKPCVCLKMCCFRAIKVYQVRLGHQEREDKENRVPK